MEKTLLAMREATGLLNPMGHLNFQGAGHCGTTLGTGDKSLNKYTIHGTYQHALESFIKKTVEAGDSLADLHLEKKLGKV